eukprot:1161025-Pelagomonas_calceolata.AAC.6
MPAKLFEHLGKKQPQQSQINVVNNYMYIDITDSRRFFQALWKVSLVYELVEEQLLERKLSARVAEHALMDDHTDYRLCQHARTRIAV